MATAASGTDGAYRMVIDERYKKLAETRRSSKLMAALGGMYAFFKLGLLSLPALYGKEHMDPAYVAFTLGLLFTFTVYVLGSGGSKPHLERSYFLWLYVPLACLLGSKALLDVLNNPITRGFFDFPILPHGTPYDQTVAKYLVKLLNYEPDAAVRTVNGTNWAVDSVGAFVLLGASAATLKYLQLKKTPSAPAEKKSK